MPVAVALGAAGAGLQTLQNTSAAQPVKPIVSQTKQTPATEKDKPAAAPKPAATPTAKPTPPPAAAPAPPKPAAVATDQQAIAAAATAPGKTVGSLTPTVPASPSPTPTPATSGSSTPSTPAPDPAPSSFSSTNWAGYFMAGLSYTAVSGSWRATNPTGNGQTTSADATWIGIGGVDTQDLIQVGTTNIVSAGGQVYSAVFYELLPDAPVYPDSIDVNPGDSISATISESSPGRWIISINNATTGQTFTTTVNYTSSHTSAEWIQEDPSYASGGLVPFDYFGSATFTNASAIADGKSYTLATGYADAITLVDSAGRALATPSVISSDGSGFSVTRNTAR